MADAQYVLILKNGRQITVQSYRTEGTMIKFTGLGGEIAIAKDQIQAIEKVGQTNRLGLSLPELEATTRQSATVPQKPTPTPTRDVAQPPGPGEKAPVDTAAAKEYQKRLADTTQKLEAAKEKYFNATQGGGTASNLSKDGISSWTMDLRSRIFDSQKVPGGGGASSTPPTPPYAPTYYPKEKELSDLRIEIDSLQKERDSLIQEMKSKNIPTGAL
ncbi:MAG: hypothetical protein ACREPG_09090 [Candidatus Binatia bacterium]